jgi:hypothetical protein
LFLSEEPAFLSASDDRRRAERKRKMQFSFSFVSRDSKAGFAKYTLRSSFAETLEFYNKPHAEI